jgi:hypothetical protein
MYKKRLAILCVLLLGLLVSRAQISMTLQVPPAGVLLKNQLWNMLLVNSGSAGTLVRVNLVLLDERSNQPVLTASSTPILLARGARQLQAKDLGPIQYIYNSPAFHADQDPNGMLVAGSYQACYTVTGVEKNGPPRAENCIQVNVDPLSPPLLNTPADEGSLYTSYPQFTWLPPTPVNLFNDLSYMLIVVEVLAGQGKADAIQQNIPVYSAGFVKTLYTNYPASYRALDTGRLYAWRIVAMNNGQATAMSDIWTFRVVRPDRPTPKREDEVYVDLKRGLDPSFASASETLRLTYENAPGDTAVHYTITALNDPGNPTVQQGDLQLHNGRNLLELSLGKKGVFAEKKIYLFRFINSRNEAWSVKFSWSPAKMKRH